MYYSNLEVTLFLIRDVNKLIDNINFSGLLSAQNISIKNPKRE